MPMPPAKTSNARAQTRPVALARTTRIRTIVAAVTLGVILGVLIVYASVQVSQGNPPPRSLMVTMMPAPAPALPPSDAMESSLTPPADELTTVAVEPATWQTTGDPPLPDHDPWAEMQQATHAAPRAPMFNGRPLRKARTLRMLVTAYSPDEQSCGIFADGITASGYSVYTNGMKLVAADTRLLPFGTIITVPGYNSGRPVPVLDRGGKIKGRRLDVLYPTHQRALQWGTQSLEVTVWEYAD